MKHTTFFWFVLPSALLMISFIALPIFSIVTQSLYTAHEQVLVTVENCGPFGCTEVTSVDQDASQALQDAEPLGKWAGLDIYKDRNHLATAEVASAWVNADGLPDFGRTLMNLPFYSALAFTLTYTFIVTPLTIVLGFFIAVAVNSVAKALKGPTIFLTLLPFIVTPLVGSLILFWMVDARGILGSGLQWLADDPALSVKASTPIQLMDNFRVFEPIVSFASQAHATSLSIAIFNDLGGETRLLSSAAATSVLTIIGIAILLSPVLVRTYRDFSKPQ